MHFLRLEQLLHSFFDLRLRNLFGADMFQIFGSSVRPFTPITLPDTTVEVPASSSLHYYLKITGVNGDVTDKDYKGAFAVDGFNFGETSPGTTGPGLGSGGATFSPLERVRRFPIEVGFPNQANNASRLS